MTLEEAVRVAKKARTTGIARFWRAEELAAFHAALDKLIDTAERRLYP